MRAITSVAIGATVLGLACIVATGIVGVLEVLYTFKRYDRRARNGC